MRPIVTPYELEVALRAEQSWTGRYVLDFEKLLSESKDEASMYTARYIPSAKLTYIVSFS